MFNLKNFITNIDFLDCTSPYISYARCTFELIVLCKINRIANPKGGRGLAHCAVFRFAVLDAKVQKVGFKAKRDRSLPPLEREIIRKLRVRTM